MKQDVAAEAAKATPPIVISGWAWFHGLTLNQAVALATLAYIALQAAYLIWKWWREWKRGRK